MLLVGSSEDDEIRNSSLTPLDKIPTSASRRRDTRLARDDFCFRSCTSSFRLVAKDAASKRDKVSSEPLPDPFFLPFLLLEWPLTL